jgi:hypothetical protein
MDPDIIQPQGDLDFFIGGKGDVLSLGSISQGGVI